jgi:CheY-like chemotaxis protein
MNHLRYSDDGDVMKDLSESRVLVVDDTETNIDVLVQTLGEVEIRSRHFSSFQN